MEETYENKMLEIEMKKQIIVDVINGMNKVDKTTNELDRSIFWNRQQSAMYQFYLHVIISVVSEGVPAEQEDMILKFSFNFS